MSQICSSKDWIDLQMQPDFHLLHSSSVAAFNLLEKNQSPGPTKRPTTASAHKFWNFHAYNNLQEREKNFNTLVILANFQTHWSSPKDQRPGVLFLIIAAALSLTIGIDWPSDVFPLFPPSLSLHDANKCQNLPDTWYKSFTLCKAAR